MVGFQIFAVGRSFMYCTGEGYKEIAISWFLQVAILERTKITNMRSSSLPKEAALPMYCILPFPCVRCCLTVVCAWSNAVNLTRGREFKIMQSFNLSFSLR